jgi:hypothetical protein
LAGGGANLPYIADFFQEKLRLPIDFFNPLKRISVGKGVDVDQVATEAHQLGELVGLALRGIGQAELEIDLVPDVVSHERDVARRKPLLMAASAILIVGLGAWAGSNIARNAEAGQKLKQLKSDSAGLEEFSGPLEKLSKREQTLDRYGKQLVAAQTARTLWIDVMRDLGENFASDSVWIVDFDPVVDFKPGADAEQKSQSVIVSDFASISYGSSALAKLKLLKPSEPARRRKGRSRGRSAAASEPQRMINAIRLKGFWRGGASGYKNVYQQIGELRKSSKHFNVPSKEDLSITLTDKLAEGDYAAPFEITIPLKNPILAPERARFSKK